MKYTAKIIGMKVVVEESETGFFCPRRAVADALASTAPGFYTVVGDGPKYQVEVNSMPQKFTKP